MDVDGRLSFFQELVQCKYPVHLWKYDRDFRLIKTDCPADLMQPDIISILGFAPLVLAHADAGNRQPLVLDTEFGLLWIAGFEYQEFTLAHIHVIGPAFSGSDSHLILRRKLDAHQLSVRLHTKVLTQLDMVPVIPTQTLLSYAVMLHCAITGERIAADTVAFSSLHTPEQKEEALLPADGQPAVWMVEQNFLKLIREGNPGYKNAFARSMTISSGMQAEIGDSLRMLKDNVIVLLTLCSRAAMEGGLNPSVAYTLNNYYIGRIEACRSLSDTNNLSHEFLEDFVGRVRNTRDAGEHARQIQNICDYIRLHIREPLSISFLADRLGYTEYYFSHKFREVKGCTVSAYIRREKMEEAKLLLSGTRMGIQEISDELSFGSRSYFFSCFRRECGCSPSEYRRKYGKF